MTTLLVIQPDAFGPLDRFDGWLTEAGASLRVVRPYAGDPVPAELGEDGLLVLGGDMDSWDDAGFPWLADVRALLLDAARRDRPTLGICLGAQLLALAHGGEVGRGAHGLEAGVVDVRRRPGADPLLDALPETFPMATMHGDEVTTLPAGATWLADGTPYPHQAFRVGATSWGVQFHPEVSPAGFARWVDGLPADQQHGRLAGVLAQDDEITPVARRLAQAFVSTCTTNWSERGRPR